MLKEPYIHCLPNHAKLTSKGCMTNQHEAARGASLLLRGVPIAHVPTHQLERVMACSQCRRRTVDVKIDKVVGILKREFDQVAQGLEEFDWYRYDSEIQEIRKHERYKDDWQRRKQQRREL